MRFLSRCAAAALVLGACVQGQNRTYTNPVGEKPVSLSDPFVLLHDGKYYLFGTTAEREGFQVYESPDLVKWKPKGWAFRKARGSWAEGLFRAPEVKLYHDRFYMVYSAQVRGSKPAKTLLGLAVSEWPAGPYYDVKEKPWFDPGFPAATGSLYTEEDGTPYVFFTRSGERDGRSFESIYGTRFSGDLTKPLGAVVPMLDAGASWEGSSVASPAVLKREGRYYMLYSGNDPGSLSYGMGYATAPAALGPWTKAPENPALASNQELKISGPGHGSIIRSPDQSELFLVYDILVDGQKGASGRVVAIDRIAFDSTGKLTVKGPTRSPQPLPAGVGR